jgi:uncharacterized protein (TIGR04255 family)
VRELSQDSPTEISKIVEERKILPKFENPPVIEVVCGIQFAPLTSMLTGHVGSLWDRYKPEYSGISEAAPLPHVIEAPSVQQEQHLKVSVSDTPDLPRTWFVHQDKTSIIQIQRDRFLYNWRKMHASDRYPSNVEVVRRFRAHLNRFTSYLGEFSLGNVSPDQYELTYINHVPLGAGWAAHGEIGRVLPDFAWRQSSERFLPTFSMFNWRTGFLLPDGKGWLHVSAKTATRRPDNQSILYLELSARGMSQNSSEDTMMEWFETAHEWIVRGFADLTSKEMHTIWNRTS